jgi:hypothetical protein
VTSDGRVVLCAIGEDFGREAPKTPLLAKQAFKNIQVLKGIPVDDFMETMGIVAASLDFDCSDCHVGGRHRGPRR